MKLVLMGDFGTHMEVVDELEAFNFLESSDQSFLIHRLAAVVKELREHETDDHLPPDPIDVDP